MISKLYVDDAQSEDFIILSMTNGGKPDQNPVIGRANRTLKYQFLRFREKLPKTVNKTRDLQGIVEKIKEDFNNKSESTKKQYHSS